MAAVAVTLAIRIAPTAKSRSSAPASTSPKQPVESVPPGFPLTNPSTSIPPGQDTRWYLLDSGQGAPAFNMALDEALLLAMPRLARPVLRFYSWTQPAASFGYFQKLADVEQMTSLRPLIRRPTGGGLVPHDADWTYSLVFPATDPWYSLRAIESYRRVHQWLQAAFARLRISSELAPGPVKAGPGQCFVGYEMFDLLCGGKKIAGAAQRRTRDGLLIQGSVRPPASAPPRAEWQEALSAIGPPGAAPERLPFELGDTLAARAKQLAREKYSQPAYNRRR